MTINQVTFNSVNFWEDLGAALTAPVDYPIPAEIKEQVKIKGMNGTLTEATGYFSDLKIKLSFKALIGRGSDLATQDFFTLKRRINKIFNSISSPELMFSDVPNRYYKVKSCVVGAVTKISDYEAKFLVEFICDPFLYDTRDITILSPERSIYYNGDIPNKPIITLSVARGPVSIQCNNVELSFTAHEGGDVVINDNPYSLVMLNNKPLKSKGVEPIFNPGRNELIISGNQVMRVTVTKNERYLG